MKLSYTQIHKHKRPTRDRVGMSTKDFNCCILETRSKNLLNDWCNSSNRWRCPNSILLSSTSCNLNSTCTIKSYKAAPSWIHNRTGANRHWPTGEKAANGAPPNESKMTSWNLSTSSSMSIRSTQKVNLWWGKEKKRILWSFVTTNSNRTYTKWRNVGKTEQEGKHKESLDSKTSVWKSIKTVRPRCA